MVALIYGTAAELKVSKPEINKITNTSELAAYLNKKKIDETYPIDAGEDSFVLNAFIQHLKDNHLLPPPA
jgi:hypothetical protein